MYARVAELERFEPIRERKLHFGNFTAENSIYGQKGFKTHEWGFTVAKVFRWWYSPTPREEGTGAEIRIEDGEDWGEEGDACREWRNRDAPTGHNRATSLLIPNYSISNMWLRGAVLKFLLFVTNKRPVIINSRQTYTSLRLIATYSMCVLLFDTIRV